MTNFQNRLDKKFKRMEKKNVWSLEGHPCGFGQSLCRPMSSQFLIFFGQPKENFLRDWTIFFVHSLKFFVQSFLKIGKNIKKKIKMWLQKDFDHKPYSTITPDPNFSCALLGIVAKRRALCFDIAIFCPVSQSIVINIGIKRHCASISWATFAILSFS